MLLSKPITAADLEEARRLLSRSRSKTQPAAQVVTPGPAKPREPRSLKSLHVRSVGDRDDGVAAPWKKTVWSETAFEPRG